MLTVADGRGAVQQQAERTANTRYTLLLCQQAPQQLLRSGAYRLQWMGWMRKGSWGRRHVMQLQSATQC